MSPHNIVRDPVDESVRCTRCAAFSAKPSPGWVSQVCLPRKYIFDVHPSHHPNMCMIKGVMFCAKCGGWAASKVSKLASPCEKPTSTGIKASRRSLQGLKPK
eukprot:4207794-Pyramimonas_sp.AAC.1